MNHLLLVAVLRNLRTDSSVIPSQRLLPLKLRRLLYHEEPYLALEFMPGSSNPHQDQTQAQDLILPDLVKLTDVLITERLGLESTLLELLCLDDFVEIIHSLVVANLSC
jgi:hypothetical protein